MALDLQTQYEEVTEAHRPFRFSRFLQRVAAVAAACPVCKMETTEAAAAARLTVEDQLQLAGLAAKETTVDRLLTLFRHLLARVVVVLVQSALTVAQFAVLAALVQPISAPHMRVVEVQGN